MSVPMNRRECLAALALASSARAGENPFTRSICSVIFPPRTPMAEMLRKAKAARFDAIELRLGADIPIDSPAASLNEIRSMAVAEGMQITSLWVSEPLGRHPLNSPDAEVRAKGVA